MSQKLKQTISFAEVLLRRFHNAILRTGGNSKGSSKNVTFQYAQMVSANEIYALTHLKPRGTIYVSFLVSK
jgi:hypothetical protein